MTDLHGRKSGDAGRRGPTPEGGPAGWERAVRIIVAAAGPELARRRRSAADPGTELLPERWARPLLAAAAAVILLAAGGLVWGGRGAPTGRSAAAGGDPAALEYALYPTVVARWVSGDVQPTVEEIAFTMVAEGTGAR